MDLMRLDSMPNPQRPESASMREFRLWWLNFESTYIRIASVRDIIPSSASSKLMMLDEQVYNGTKVSRD